MATARQYMLDPAGYRRTCKNLCESRGGTHKEAANLRLCTDTVDTRSRESVNPFCTRATVKITGKCGCICEGLDHPSSMLPKLSEIPGAKLIPLAAAHGERRFNSQASP